MAGTRAPSGLKITRQGLKFIATWKISDTDYQKGHQCRVRWRTNKWSKWLSLECGSKTTSRSYTFTAADFSPNKSTCLTQVQFEVRGRRGDTVKDKKTTTYDWSAWSINTFVVYDPRIPSLTATLNNQLDNVTTFAWNVTVDNTDHYPFTDVEWQTMLVKDCTETDGSKLSWSSSKLGYNSGTGTRASQQVITEDTTLLANNSYTRWFRVRSRGFGGSSYAGGASYTGRSYWRYARHVYAVPNKPKINSVEQTLPLNWIRVNWTAGTSVANPIDKTDVDWTIDTPKANRVVPDSPTWTTAHSFKDTAGNDEASFLVDRAVSLDECLWVRINVTHDRNENASAAKLVVSGDLTPPTNLSVETDDSTYTATITATNNSTVPDSRLAVVYRAKTDIVVGIIEHGLSEITVRCPDWSQETAIAFGVYAFQGKATAKTSGGITTYAVTPNMRSSELWHGGNVPVAPSSVTAEATDTDGEVLIEWSWAWGSANRTEISWSQNPNSWESTDEPSTYMISNLHAAKWRVSGLTTGATWYFRLRHGQQIGDDITYGPYCDPIAVDLSSEPNIPMLSLSKPVITEGEQFTAYWIYSTTDGTQQDYAEICEATVSGDTVTYGDVIAHTMTAQNVTIDPPTEWVTGSTHTLCVRVQSASGRVSEWSDPVAVAVADPIVCTITQTSLETITVGEDDEEYETLALTQMPLTATITGGGTTTLMIERAAEYHVIRPDERVKDGYDGETVVIYRQTGAAQITITNDDLLGVMDDGAAYRLIAQVEDGLGQTDTQELAFEVHWTHQAEAPTATVFIQDNAAIITPVAPESADEGDVFDIYRLTADLPELIVQGGEYGDVYVDPFPAIGTGYGHRIVHRTVNGDYITPDNTPAWIDLDDTDGDVLDLDHGVIEFGDYALEFVYNAGVTNTWEKDFKQTRYLGGSMVGDWNAGVSRTSSIDVIVVTDDADEFSVLRRLAEYTGICHVRTPEGSSYSADVQVSDSLSYEDAGIINQVTLTITRVDAERLDGIPYDEWTA